MGRIGRRIGKAQTSANDGTGFFGDSFFQDFFQRQGNIYNAPGVFSQGLTATGGVISDYNTPPGAVYRAHIFTSSGTFSVTAPGTFGDTVDYLVIGGGGGGGGAYEGGGGGAGGYRATTPEGPGGPSPVAETQITVSGPFPSPYTITIGAGGVGGASDPAQTLGLPQSVGTPGGQSAFYPTPVSYPSPTYIRSEGGGGGGTYNSPGTTNVPGIPGGSGGGAGNQAPGTGGPFPGGTGNREANTSTPVPNQGYPGGTRGNQAHAPFYNGSGGGGAGGAGSGNTDNTVAASRGGIGKSSSIAGPVNDGIGAPGPSPGRWFAGGGGGGIYGSGQPTGGAGGGTGGPYAGAGNGGVGGGPPLVPASNAIYATGAGGGASGDYTTIGGKGGSGIVVVRYQIAQLTATAKATGGAISYYGGKTIHTFTSSGAFTAPTSFNETVEYVVIGGGGSGAKGYNQEYGASGAGAGTYRTNSTPLNNSGGGSPLVCPVTIGAGGASTGGPNNSQIDGNPGSTTTLAFPSSIASPGGGRGSYPTTTGGRANGPGGSGGGGSGRNPGVAGSPATGAPFPGTIGATPTSGWGHPGGPSAPATDNAGGGGGGAGGNGGPTGGGPGNGGPGGVGIQLPATFRDPKSAVGAPGPTSPPVSGADTSGKYYVAGGGGGFGYSTTGSGGAGGGGAGGSATVGPTYGIGVSAAENTGSGGGAGGADGSTGYASGSGGSGIVIIAYPS